MSTQTDKILPTLQELRDNGESDPKASLIFQALGAASVCWEKIEGAGVFDSDRAKRIGDELLSELEAQPLQTDKVLTDDLGAHIRLGTAPSVPTVDQMTEALAVEVEGWAEHSFVIGGIAMHKTRALRDRIRARLTKLLFP